MDLAGAFLWRIVRPVNRALMAELWWARERRAGNRATEVVDRMVGGGDLVLDIGANYGLFSYRLAKLVGPSGEVHAFEPHPAQRDNLERVAAARPQVRFHPVALSARPGRAEMAVPVIGGRPDLALATLEHRSAEDVELHHVEVPVETLDRVMAGRSRSVDFVKCDVEGHERTVFQGAAELLERDAPTLLVEIEQRHQPGDIRETFRLLEDLGYDGHAIREDGLAPVSGFDPERDQLRFVRQAPEAGEMPPEYVNDFVFVSRRRAAGIALP